MGICFYEGGMMTDFMKEFFRLLWTMLTIAMLTISVTDMFYFVGDSTYNEIIEFLDKAPDPLNPNAPCADHLGGGSDCSLVSTCMKICKYFAYGMCAIICISIILQQFINCCKDKRRVTRYVVIGEENRYQESCCESCDVTHGCHDIEWSNRWLTSLVYVLYGGVIILWFLYVSKMRTFVSGGLGYGMYAGIISLIMMGFQLVVSFLICKNYERSGGRGNGVTGYVVAVY